MSALAIQAAFWSAAIQALLSSMLICVASEKGWERFGRLTSIVISVVVVVGLWPSVFGAVARIGCDGQ